MRSDAIWEISFQAGLRRGARFVADRRGAVALMFGLMILPLFAAIGLAIDFGNIMTSRTKAQTAADAAALQASGIARDLIKNGDGSDALTAAALAEAKQRGEALFRAHADQSGLKGYTLKLTIKREGQSLNTTAAFDVQTDTFIGRVSGTNSFKAAGAASASSSLPTYVDVHVLMDVSQSMGLAATDLEAKKLFNITSCVFGCHVKRTEDKKPLEQVAHENGIRLRVDVLRDAVTKMINDAQANSAGDSVYRFGLYTMSLNAAMSTHALNEISPLSGNFTQLRLAANNIDLSANNDSSGRGDSHIDFQIEALKAKVANSGDGSKQSKAKVFVFIITDGLRDYRTTGAVNQHVTGPINPAKCDPYKNPAVGVTVGVLYTTYLPILKNPNNPGAGLESNYVSLVKPHITSLPQKLQECASKDWFFEASDEPGISAAINKMFSQTTQAPSLTH